MQDCAHPAAAVAWPSVFGSRPTTEEAPARRGLGLGGSLFLIRLLVPLAAVIIAVIAFSKSGKAHHSPSKLRVVSYLTESNIAAGLSTVSRLVPGSRIILLLLDSGTLSAQVLVPGGSKTVDLIPSGSQVSRLSAPPFPSSEYTATIQPAVVPRTIGELRALFHVSTSQVDDATAQALPGQPAIWSLNLYDGRTDRAYSRRGRLVRMP